MSKGRLPSWSARRQTSYIVALDDSGQKAVRPSEERRCFFLGGVILPALSLEKLRRNWISALGEEEIKARTYAASIGFEDHPIWAEALLSVQMADWEALPLWFSYDKGVAGPDATLPTRRGGRMIDTSLAMISLAAALSAHLRHARGRVDFIYFDHLASRNDEDAMQTQWRTARGQLHSQRQKTLPEELEFVDSKTAPEIQVADVLLGLIRADQETTRPLAPGLSRLLAKAQAQFLPGFHLS